MRNNGSGMQTIQNLVHSKKNQLETGLQVPWQIMEHAAVIEMFKSQNMLGRSKDELESLVKFLLVSN